VHWNRSYCFAVQGPLHSSGSKLPAWQSAQRHPHRQGQRGYESRLVAYQIEWSTAARLMLTVACKERLVLQALGRTMALLLWL